MNLTKCHVSPVAVELMTDPAKIFRYANHSSIFKGRLTCIPKLHIFDFHHKASSSICLPCEVKPITTMGMGTSVIKIGMQISKGREYIAAHTVIISALDRSSFRLLWKPHGFTICQCLTWAEWLIKFTEQIHCCLRSYNTKKIGSR